MWFQSNYVDVWTVHPTHQIMSLKDLMHHYSEGLQKNLNSKMFADCLFQSFSLFS